MDEVNPLLSLSTASKQEQDSGLVQGALSVQERADADQFIQKMRKTTEWKMPLYRHLGKGLGELRWVSEKKQHRLIGFGFSWVIPGTLLLVAPTNRSVTPPPMHWKQPEPEKARLSGARWRPLNMSFETTFAKLQDPEYRRAFLSSQVNIGIPFQIRALLKSKGWTQDTLAERTGMLQPRISALLSPGKVRPNIETLRRIAEAFDCGLQVRFVPFSELVQASESFDPEHFSIPSFDEEIRQAEKREDGLVASLHFPTESASVTIGTGRLLDEFYTSAATGLELGSLRVAPEAVDVFGVFSRLHKPLPEPTILSGGFNPLVLLREHTTEQRAP